MGISTRIWLILPAQSMGMLVKSLKHSIWYASKILHGTRYAEQNKEVRGTPWGEGGIASCLCRTWLETPKTGLLMARLLSTQPICKFSNFHFDFDDRIMVLIVTVQIPGHCLYHAFPWLSRPFKSHIRSETRTLRKHVYEIYFDISQL